MIKKLLLAIFLFSASAGAVSSQVNPERAILEARKQFSDIKNRSMELERLKRENDRRPVSENAALKFAEIKEDFEQIQILTSRLLEMTAATAPADYSMVSKLSADIKRRAVRLRSNLFPAEAEEAKEPKNTRPPDESQDVKVLSEKLDKSVGSFVHNSMFQNLNLVNSDDSLKAQEDLDAVILAASAIREKTKKLAKADSRK